MVPVVVMTAHGTIESAVKAVKEGAFDFLQKPVDPDHLLIIIGKALETRQLVTENLILKEELSQTKYAKMVGQSRALLEAQEKAKKVAVGTTTVLLLGESGTGKERSEEHTSELQSRLHLVCRLLLEKKKNTRLTAGRVSVRDSRACGVH